MSSITNFPQTPNRIVHVQAPDAPERPRRRPRIVRQDVARQLYYSDLESDSDEDMSEEEQEVHENFLVARPNL